MIHSRWIPTLPYLAFGLLIAVLLSGCAALKGDAARGRIPRLALLAPFEGREREIGYNALYAARLAFADAGVTSFDLLPVDDGGSPARAAERAAALMRDSQVTAALLLGPHAASKEAQDALEDIPAILIGTWGEPSGRALTYALFHPNIYAALTIPARLNAEEAARLASSGVVSNTSTGADIFSLSAVRHGIGDSWMQLASSGSPPPEFFSERYVASGLFVPRPNHLATLVYDAAALLAAARPADRHTARLAIAQAVHEGLSGVIAFENGYWANAPLNIYAVRAGGLILMHRSVNNVIEQR